MSFRKRNLGLSSPSPSPSSPTTTRTGVRPSPLNGRPTISTGTQTLDDLLGGHAGFPLGTSVLLEESGVTDFAGALCRSYAAEGVVQGHWVHVVGVGEGWGRELPGLVDGEGGMGWEGERGKEKMKIAWRYERLGEFGVGRGRGRGDRAPSLPNRTRTTSSDSPEPASVLQQPFCHTFDLSKRLTPPASHPPITYIPIPVSSTSSPFTPILNHLSTSLSTPSQETSIHRLLLPLLLSPTLYPPSSSQPTHLLPFLHSLRALLRQYPTRLTAMLTLPLSLHPRSEGLVRWVELLCDAVVELAPFPGGAVEDSGAARSKEEKMQGLVRVWRGAGAGAGGEDLAFSVGRKRFLILPFRLPPVEGEKEEEGEGTGGKAMKVDVEF